MTISSLRKLLTNNDRFTPENSDFRRVYLLNAVLLIVFTATMAFAILNAVFYRYISMYANFSATLTYLVILIIFHKTDRLEFCSWATVVVTVSFMIAMFALNGHKSELFIWISVVPPLIFFLLGRKKGLIVTFSVVLYFLIFSLLSYQKWQPDVFGFASFFNIIGSIVIMLVLISYAENSRVEAVKVAHRKNSELEQANKALGESKDQLRLILDSTAEAIFGLDIEGRCTFCNASCLEILGFKTEAEIIGKDVHELIHSKNRDGSPLPKLESKIFKTCMEGTSVHADDEVFWREGGVSFDVEYHSYPQYKNGELIGAVVTFIDNTLKKLHEQQIEYFSSHDALTGLLNRSSFEYLLSKADQLNNLPISIIMGDLNGLKLTNDVFGHGAGDELLVKAAEAIKKACREGDIVSRLGGDEFVILLPKTQSQDAQNVISRIREALSQEKTGAIKCSMSLGVDTKMIPIQSIDITLKNAENDMYKEKALNRNRVDTDMINTIIMMLYQKCPFEERHAANVSELCRAMGEALDLQQTEIILLRNAGFLHDIGKVGIQNGILSTQENLTIQEDAEYRQHPVIGYRILNLFDNTVNQAEAVYSHHEKWDGTGYPRGLKAEEIPLIARIIAVAARYDTLLYRNSEAPADPEAALRHLEADAGTFLDPRLVELFVSLIERNGSIGAVDEGDKHSGS